MRVHGRESERPSNVDLLSKILRRGSHAADPSDDSSGSNSAMRKSITQLGELCIGGRSRKSSHAANNHSNNQQRLSITGSGGGGTNSRFSAFFIDPLYHAITMGKSKDDGARTSISAASSYYSTDASSLGAAAAAAVLTIEEVSRRQVLMALAFDDLHLAFDPYNGADPEHAMDNNELETLLELNEESRQTLELKAPAQHSSSSDESEHESADASDVEATGATQSEAPTAAPGHDDCIHDDGEELHFDAPNMAVSVKKLMHRIKSVSAVLSSDLDVSARSNQDDDDDDDSNEDTEAPDRDTEADDTVVVIDDASLESLEPLMLETTATPTYVPSCFPQAEMPQNLSASVRRLVIDLKDDSDRRYDAPHQHGFSARRRGNSCPVPLRSASGPDAGTASTSPPTANTPTASPAYLDSESERKHKKKKKTFGRLAPRLLETLTFRRKKKTFHYTDEELESIEGARWKIVELAFRFGGKHRFYLVQAVNMFFPLLKYGRRGGPHPTRLHCNHCGSLQWQHKRGSLSESVDLAHVLQVLDGRQTAVFRKYPTSAALDACSFSIIFTDRTLDLETQSVSHRDWLMCALRTLISYSKTQRAAEERAIAERCILPLDDLPPLTTILGSDLYDELTSPSAGSRNARLLL